MQMLYSKGTKVVLSYFVSKGRQMALFYEYSQAKDVLQIKQRTKYLGIKVKCNK